jgi:hypothetical protein
MASVLCNVMTSDWSVNFIGPDGKTRIGPWLLLDSHDEVRASSVGAISPMRSWQSTKAASGGGECQQPSSISPTVNSLRSSSAVAAGPGTAMSCD